MMRTLRRGLGVAALGALAATPIGATTLLRADVDTLTAASDTIVYGDVVGARSYWNEDKTFILTDVRIAPREVLKGAAGGELTVTLMGGSVGDRTVMVVGGAALVPGQAYVLFVGTDDLPGRAGARTVPGHAQGVFEVRQDADGSARAVSQANDQPLVPDALGRSEVPGGRAGLALPALLDTIRQAAAAKGGAR
jgi:hypothetical protein